MPREDRRFIGENQQSLVNRPQDFLVRPAPQVRTADASLEQGITTENLLLLARKVEGEAARRVSRRVQDLQDMRAEAQSVTLFQELIHIHNTRREETQPFRLLGQILVERQICRMHQDSGSRGAFQLLEATHMVDMRVRGDDVLGPQLVLGQHFLDTFNLVPRVNNDGLAGLFIADDGTVTGQHSHGKNLVNHPRLAFLSPPTIVLEFVDLPGTLFYTRFQREQGVRQQMKLVVVGGQVRKVGKTSVIAELIRGLNSLAWTAVKISHHGGDADSQDRQSADDLPAHLDFLWSEEKDPNGHHDTSQYLAAGARRALWMRARGGTLAQALPGLLKALEGDEHVIIESNSILAFLKPAVFLFIIDESRRELKASARQFLPRADAFVRVGPELKAPVWPGMSLPMLEDKPVFPVSAGEWSNPALSRFVRERLAAAREQEILLGPSFPTRE